MVIPLTGKKSGVYRFSVGTCRNGSNRFRALSNQFPLQFLYVMNDCLCRLNRSHMRNLVARDPEKRICCCKKIFMARGIIPYEGCPLWTGPHGIRMGNLFENNPWEIPLESVRQNRYRLPPETIIAIANAGARKRVEINSYVGRTIRVISCRLL